MTFLKSFLDNQHHVKLIRENRKAWLMPTIVMGVIGSLVAITRPSVWVASQGLIVRDEVVGELSPNGRFDSTDARRAAQEMILQVARNRQVVVNSLKVVTPADKQNEKFPKESLVRDWQDAIAVTAGKGVELGESDVIYLQVEGGSADDAVRNASVVAEQLGQYLNVLRNQRMDSVIQELEEKLKLAVANRDTANQRLEAMEREIGSDLGELRTLNRSGTGESNLRTALSQIKSDLRNARSGHTRQLEQLQFLRGAVHDPQSIVATPNSVLEAHPSLRRLKDGLVDAQLRLADLLGKMNGSHPNVRAAQVAVSKIHEKLRLELRTAVRSAEAELRVNQALLNSYERQLKVVNNRMNSLAAMRARYDLLVADVEDRNAQVKVVQRKLSDSRASRNAGETSRLITLVDRPEPSDGPVGPGRLTLLVAAWLGAFFVSIGFLFLIAPPNGSLSGTGRRLADRLAPGNLGRRATDRGETTTTPPGRRQTDHQPPATVAYPGTDQATESTPSAAPVIVPLDSSWAADKPLTDPESR